MALFEQRVSEDDVTAARERIAAGASLRAAAAEIPCAPSTLSIRIKKAEEAEADARERGRDNEHRTVQGADENADLRALAAAQGAVSGEVGPVEILRGALLATKASGQADWPTRVSAARALAALRPEEVEPTAEQQTPSIVVYDLPPGTDPVLHRGRKESETSVVPAEAPSEELQPPELHTFLYRPDDGQNEVIGSWDAGILENGGYVSFHTTDDRETATLWLAELAAGRLPQSTENIS
jgi:hypothetical protein